MHKHTKLPPTMREEVYRHWVEGKYQRFLADEYHVDKVIIKRIIVRGRLGDFSVHDSTNQRYRTVEYGLKKLLKPRKGLKRDWSGKPYDATRSPTPARWCMLT